MSASPVYNHFVQPHQTALGLATCVANDDAGMQRQGGRLRKFKRRGDINLQIRAPPDPIYEWYHTPGRGRISRVTSSAALAVSSIIMAMVYEPSFKDGAVNDGQCRV